MLKFAGVETISDAEQLAGLELQVPLEQRAELEQGAAYVSDVVGCEVWIRNADGQRLLGTVSEVQFGAGEAPLLVVRAKIGTEQEILLPYAEEFLKSVDFEQRTELEAGATYVSDVVGCEVWIRNADGQQLLGTVSEVQFGAGEAPLLVVRAKIGAEQEILVPYAEEFLKSADFQQRRIEMELPEGLLALESPLSGEEKQRQKTEADESRSAGVRRKRGK